MLEELGAQPFFGRVLGRFKHACNLIDEQGRIIALTLPVVGNGPFTIVVPGDLGLFNALLLNQPVRANYQTLFVGQWHISLSQASVWEPKIVSPDQPLKIKPMAEIIKPYADGPRFDESTPVARNMAHRARQAAARLSQAITRRESQTEVAQAVAQLAGLGSGLTPAGDDYLLGVMVALWLTGQIELLPEIAEVASPKTTALSRAFLRAAARGEFIEPWHELAQAWLDQDRPAVARAVAEIAQVGASSGAAALAGFARTMFSLANRSMPLP